MHIFLQTQATSEGFKVMGGVAVVRLVWAIISRIARNRQR